MQNNRTSIAGPIPHRAPHLGFGTQGSRSHSTQTLSPNPGRVTHNRPAARVLKYQYRRPGKTDPKNRETRKKVVEPLHSRRVHKCRNQLASGARPSTGHRTPAHDMRCYGKYPQRRLPDARRRHVPLRREITNRASAAFITTTAMGRAIPRTSSQRQFRTMP